jgi:hypothetical protein
MARGAPYLFTLGVSEGRLLRNLVHWADGRGALKGHKVGIYYLDDATGHERVEGTLVPELAKLGYHVAATVTTSQSLGGPQDAVAVQRFRSKGVDVAILLTSKMGFLQQAQAQGYTPKYIDSDEEYGTSDTATSTYPAAEWDTTFGMTTRRVGESAAGEPLSPQQEACVANYERVTGEKVGRPGKGGHESAVFSYILVGCDEGTILLNALKAAGAGLTPQSFVTGAETIHNLPMLRYFPVTFGPGKHDGTDSQRTVQWRSSCTCWVAMGQAQSLAVH